MVKVDSGACKSQNSKGRGLLLWIGQLWLRDSGKTHINATFFPFSVHPSLDNEHGSVAEVGECNRTVFWLKSEHQGTRKYLEVYGEAIIQESRAISCLWNPEFTSELHTHGFYPNYRPKKSRTELRDYHSGPRLATGWYMSEADLNSSANALKTGLPLESWPTEGRL